MNKAGVMRSRVKGTHLKCYNKTCEYEWEYRGSLQYACCPSCRRSIKVSYAKQ